MKSIKKLLFVVVVVAALVVAVTYFRDTSPPQVGLTPATGPVSPRSELLLTLSDEGTGIRQVTVNLVQGDFRMQLAQREFPAATAETTLPLSLAELKLREGAFTIEVTAGDHSVYRLGKGNVTEQSYPLTYDSRPPVVSVISRAHNFTRGGGGLVTFTVDEPVSHIGVEFKDHFFPAFKQPSGSYASTVAFPYYVEPKDFVPRIVAVDLAGNERQTGIYYRANNRQFRQRQINITDNFLSMTLPEFNHLVPAFDTPIETFLYINRQIRQENRDAVAALSPQTSPQPLWEGVFLQQPRAATQSQFGDHRTYMYNGREINKTVHLGHDLASTAQVEIFSANHGKVIFNDYLGIYGLCIVIDHGVGVQTLYAHLSQSSVAVGQPVQRGEIIGRSGVTGLAGGDHLHFEVLIAGIPVYPLEWWDASWLENNIDSKLRPE